MPNHFADSQWTISPAQPDELLAAIELLFANLPLDTRRTRVLNVYTLLSSHEIDPAGVFVARMHDSIHGVFVCMPMPGAASLVWPPRHTTKMDRIHLDALIAAGLDWLRQRDIRLAEVIGHADDLRGMDALIHHGFRPAGPLLFFRHELETVPKAVSEARFIPYPEVDSETFAETLEATYQETADLPELSGVRTRDEVMAGYRESPLFRSSNWFLAEVDKRPAGVLMLTEIEPLEGWDLTYVGIVPEMRRRGLGRALVSKALEHVAQAGGSWLEVAVDARNRPGVQLYASTGFHATFERQVFLYFFPPARASSTSPFGPS